MPRTLPTTRSVARLPLPRPSAPGFTLPRLTGTPVRRTRFVHDPRVTRLARVLLEAGLGTAEDWFAEGQTPVAFIRRTFERFTAARIPGAEFRWFSATLTTILPESTHAPYPDDTDLRNDTRFLIEAEPNSYVTAMMGPTLDAMERDAGAQVASTFYHLVEATLQHWFYIFDRHEARWRTERDRDLNEDIEDEEDLVEVIDVYEPPCLSVTPLKGRAAYQTLKRLHDPALRRFFQDALELADLAAHGKPDPPREDVLGERYRSYEGDPLTAVLLCFEPGDSIQQHMDTYAASALESGHIPSCFFLMDAARPETVVDAFRRYGLLCQGLPRIADLCQRLPVESLSPTSPDD